MKNKQLIFLLILLQIMPVYLFMSGCKSTKTLTNETVRIDSVYTIKRDTTYFSRDSSGHTYYSQETKEYHHYYDTIIKQFVPVIQRETIYKEGQIVYVNVDSGKASQIDSSAYWKEVATRAKAVEKKGVWMPWWIWVIVGTVGVAGLLIIFQKIDGINA